ncbi:TetR/AcrR family transcriptional regulator [Actinopolyspora mortivallis]|uniref:TetR/AcrR family transcriptional regulator n=1 Tax=Actinopolyspora mortivallis TaxID=33906 RepID=UPI0021592C8E|nr:TetR/AcrR family transcriptional regulator [Actinopolyspora mortivallis]
MTRPFREQVDEQILDRAAELFAQHGFAQTSLKALAEAVGLSKAGLLHHYPSKEAIHGAALEMGSVHARRVRDDVAAMPPGPSRDLRVLELLTDVALDRPGLVALAFRPITAPSEHPAMLDDEEMLLHEMFVLDPDDHDSERLVRIIGALSALAVLTLTANREGDKTTWRPRIIATCFDALGHSRADVPPSGSRQLED